MKELFRNMDQAVARRTTDKIEGNDTNRTQEIVRQSSKLDGNAIIGNLSPEEKQRLYEAIRKSEGWKPGSSKVVRNPPES